MLLEGLSNPRGDDPGVAVGPDVSGSSQPPAISGARTSPRRLRVIPRQVRTPPVKAEASMRSGSSLASGVRVQDVAGDILRDFQHG